MLFQLENISKAYGIQGEPGHQVVLDDLSFTAEKGESIAVLGPSGSGKTTLLNILGTLDYPDSGSYAFKGTPVHSMAGSEMDYFRNREIGFVFQFHHLLPQCNVLENVLIPTLVNKQGNEDSREYAKQLLEKVGLWEHRHKRPAQLSGGERQRTAVVRAMINRPSLILADEPTGALDGRNVEAISSLLLGLNREEKVTMVIVTHSGELAGEMDAVFELREGKLVRK